MGIVRKLAVRSYRKELKNFIELLKLCKRKDGIEGISTTLIFGIWVRAILDIEGLLHTFKEEDGSINPELHAYPMLLGSIQEQANFYANQPEHIGKYMGLLIWVHTLRGIIRPEIMPEVKQMWDIFMESKPCWDETLKMVRNEDLRTGGNADMVKKIEALTKKIINVLPPKELDFYK